MLTIYDPKISWSFIDDFNCILGAHEKHGGTPPCQLACEELAFVSNLANLIYMRTHGFDFTWSNGREGMRYVEVRLDRVIHNAAWIKMWSVTSCKAFDKICSDHYPLLC